MWTPKATATAGWLPPAGVEWREYSDEAFAEVERGYDAQFKEKGALRRFFEHRSDEDRATGEKAGGARRERR